MISRPAPAGTTTAPRPAHLTHQVDWRAVARRQERPNQLPQRTILVERARPDLPRGTVTFLFTDIEGPTQLLQERGGEYAEMLVDHRLRLREEFERPSNTGGPNT